MTRKPRQTFSAEFKLEAVRLLEQGDKNAVRLFLPMTSNDLAICKKKKHLASGRIFKSNQYKTIYF